jgi:DNA polymerase-3 subunit gamma/tau
VGAAGSAPDLNVLVERWDAVTATVRAAGRGILAAALEHVYPVAVTGTGVVTVEVGDGASAPVVEAGQADILAALRATFAGVQRLVVRAAAAAEPPAARRVTAESVKTDRTATLRRKDPTLNAAIDALDLDLVE